MWDKDDEGGTSNSTSHIPNPISQISLFIPDNHTSPIHVSHQYQAFRDIPDKFIHGPLYPFPFIIIIMNKDDPAR
jgi:hypothetical protein